MIQRLHLNDNKLSSWTYKDPIIFNHNSQINKIKSPFTRNKIAQSRFTKKYWGPSCKVEMTSVGVHQSRGRIILTALAVHCEYDLDAR